MTVVLPLVTAAGLGAAVYLLRQAAQDSTGPTASTNEKAITTAFVIARRAIEADTEHVSTGPYGRPLWPGGNWLTTSPDQARRMLETAQREPRNGPISE